MVWKKNFSIDDSRSVLFELSFEMEYPEDQYYRLNRVYLSTIGLWPYNNFKIRCIRFITLLILVSMPGVQWIKLYVSECTYGLVIEILSYNIIYIVCCIKYISFCAVVKSVKEFQGRIRSNWVALKDNKEIEIINEHGIYGKLITISLMIFAYSSNTMVILLQYTSIFLDIIIPLNASRPPTLIVPAEYLVDQEKYFYIITTHISIGTAFETSCFIATESFSLVNAIHAFGLFKVASYRIKHVLNGINPHMCVTKNQNISQHRIIAAVDFHRRAIEFSDLIKVTFGPSYLIMLVLGVCSISVNFFYIAQIIVTNRNIVEIIKCSSLISFLILYITVANFAGQEFINCDTHFYRMICNINWYNTPVKTQKLILFLLRKTTKSYKLDLCGMFTPCLEGLATIFSMSISYVMVLYSV
ncbi:PREDICTED: uncharacterized protein LOC105564559 isoform X2 [Vollenhovia emeryi]|uniref:uncharacterized protein LOC105564559 isoform X2 n=1 Tax=Vollenhovia emeryi TaxID=411798 RepID=UPI0005F42BEB|nr:PREDICTED: uncharacterized protein LOC105564559 isoform X2 [Vollenhovia emeryi]